jgi:hypothetical protein
MSKRNGPSKTKSIEQVREATIADLKQIAEKPDACTVYSAGKIIDGAGGRGNKRLLANYSIR